MSRGPSGRIVVEIEPPLKTRLYTELAKEGITLKSWIIDHAKKYISEKEQPSLFISEQTQRMTGNN
jgi:hypothetical protein